MAVEVTIWNRVLAVSHHAEARMQQRGINTRMVGIALAYGERDWSHAAIRHRVTERSLRGTPCEDESDRLRGLCVVVSGDGMVITAKWDYRLRRPGPLRRSNPSRARALRAARKQETLAPGTVVPSGLRLAA